jgi:hypothetical protein
MPPPTGHGARYRLGADGHELDVIRRRVTRAVAEAVARGPARFGLLVEPPLLALLYRFRADGPRGDAPFVWHLLPGAEGAELPRPALGLRSALTVRLIGSRDGLVYARRRFLLPEGFTAALHAALSYTARSPFDPALCGRAVANYALRPARARWGAAVARVRTGGEVCPGRRG